jgi:3-mercaptopyruvate sulfurtransferase SseA
MKISKKIYWISSIVVASIFAGCGSNNSSDTTDDNNNTNNGTDLKVQTPSDYAKRSDSDYEQNRYGLVSAKHVASLITDWKTKKPEGKRNLFIMQYGNIYGFSGTHKEPISATEMIDMGNGYIKSDPANNVFVYDRTSGCTTTGDSRGDGVSSVPKPVFTLAQMDQAFATYGIDPDKDVLILLLGSPDPEKAGNYMAGVARMWYTLTYWGFPQESILMLNGQASNILNPEKNADISAMGITKEQIFTQLPSNYRAKPEWKSISKVKVDGTILQATMKDVMNVVDAENSSDVILDARSEKEYFGEKQAKTEYKICGETGDKQCYTAFDGHIKGAKNLYFLNVLNHEDGTEDINDDNKIDYRDSSFTFKSLSELDTLFADAGYKSGSQIYTYCRTGTKASLLTFTSSAVLGYKTRIYDGSWIQWGKMANVNDFNGTELVPANNQWLTDVYSESVTYNPTPSTISPFNRAELNLDAKDTDAIIKEDKSVKKI